MFIFIYILESIDQSILFELYFCVHLYCICKYFTGIWDLSLTHVIYEN